MCVCLESDSVQFVAGVVWWARCADQQR